MSIYTITFQTFFNRIIPPSKRTTLHLLWGKVMLTPLQWLRNLAFNTYKTGDSSADYDSLTAYVRGDRVKVDKTIYECILATTGVSPIDLTGATYWQKIQDIYIGLDERIKYNSQTLQLEFILNKWFGSTFNQPTAYVAAPTYYTPKSDIYITNNNVKPNLFILGATASESSVFKVTPKKYLYATAVAANYAISLFTINVPTALYSSIAATSIEADKLISQVVNKYVAAGIIYDIKTY